MMMTGSKKYVLKLNRKSKAGLGAVLIVGLIVVIILAVAGGTVYYLYFNPSTSHGIGTSSISLSQSSVSEGEGGTALIPYTVSLASGTKWGTSIAVVNNASLASKGITVTPSTPAMDPPFSGTLSITVSPNAPTGTYTVTLKAAGDDPSTSNVDFALTVTTPGSSSSTVTSSSPTVTTTTTTSSYAYSTSSSQTTSCTGYYC